MPLQVKGEDGRVIHDQLSDGDAKDLAAKVHENTGETVTLVPWRLVEGVYELDPEMTQTFGAPVAEAVDLAESVETVAEDVPVLDPAPEEFPLEEAEAEVATEEPATE